MRCLFISPNFKPNIGGIPEHTHQITRALIKRRHHVTVLASGLGTKAEAGFDAACGYPVIRMDRPLKGMAGLVVSKVRLFTQTIRAIRDVRPDYILLSSASSLVPTSASALASIMCGIPSLHFVHNAKPYTNDGPLGRIKRYKQGVALRISTMAVAVSENSRIDAISMGVDSDKAFVVRSGVDLSEVDLYLEGRHSPPASGPPKEPVILTLSRLGVHKGIDRVIEAMPKVLQAVPSARYVVVGDGDYRKELEAMSSRSSASEAIEFKGFLTGKEKWAAYDKCSLFVLPSSREGFALVFLEASVFGKPTIGTNVTAIPEVVVHGETGLLVDPDDNEGLAKAIIELLTDPARARRMGRTGQERVRTEFTWERSADALLELLRDQCRLADTDADQNADNVSDRQ